MLDDSASVGGDTPASDRFNGPPELTVTEKLRALSCAYAEGVDRRDRDLVRNVFAPTATLTVHGRKGLQPLPEFRFQGRDAIGGIVDHLSDHPITFHMLGQGRYQLTDEGARGEVYCEAHHVGPGDGGGETDRIMYIRYQDQYRSHPDGGWQILERTVEVDRTTDRPLDVRPDGSETVR
jgi:hypothetical protein